MTSTAPLYLITERVMFIIDIINLLYHLTTVSPFSSKLYWRRDISYKRYWVLFFFLHSNVPFGQHLFEKWLIKIRNIYFYILFHTNSAFYIVVSGGPSWSWFYGSCIYNYLCNQCPSPLKLWDGTSFMARCTRYNIMW